ncbi:MAG: hypothetical protein ACOX3W_00520 [Christensenellaceae bacterium]|jgi:hypothetical protein
MNDKYESSANTIVLTRAALKVAVKDYRAALRKLNKHPRNQAALNTKEEVERFFHSDWYRLLTSLDPDMLIKQLNEEVEQ